MIRETMVMFELADCITPERKLSLRGALLVYRRSATRILGYVKAAFVGDYSILLRSKDLRRYTSPK
jgi:hypothetical protein